MIQVRRGCPSESLTLTSVAMRAEAYWGFDVDYMNSFREKYPVSSEFIEANHVFVAAEGDDVLGFFALVPGISTACLEFMYIDPGCLRRGIGRILSWIREARPRRLDPFLVNSREVASPISRGDAREP